MASQRSTFLLLSLATIGIFNLPVYFLTQKEITKFSFYSIILNQVGLIYDNVVVGIGKYIFHHKTTFSLLNKGRFVFHSLTMPLIAFPLLEIATKFGTNSFLSMDYAIFSFLSRNVQTFITCFVIFELIHWTVQVDATKDLKVIDLRQSTTNQKSNLGGTIASSLASHVNPVRFILPTVLIIIFQIMLGVLLLSTTAGRILLGSGLLNLISPGLFLPELQLLAEHIFVGSIWYCLAIL